MKSQRLNAIYASPLRRTQETALAIGEVAGVEVQPRQRVAEEEAAEDEAHHLWRGIEGAELSSEQRDAAARQIHEEDEQRGLEK